MYIMYSNSIKHFKCKIVGEFGVAFTIVIQLQSPPGFHATNRYRWITMVTGKCLIKLLRLVSVNSINQNVLKMLDSTPPKDETCELGPLCNEIIIHESRNIAKSDSQIISCDQWQRYAMGR